MVSAVAGQPIRLRLPATSANLGPGFDAAGLALSISLDIDARLAPAGHPHRIHARGRDAALCGAVEHNLILDTYADVLRRHDRPAPGLDLVIQNGIPLGMGCGSSAAALLGGVLLASHFGGLGWDLRTAMEEACRREGHPDNVAACALGGMTVSCVAGGRILTATFGDVAGWKLFVALPSVSLSTQKARALLPPEYSKPDAIFNVQRVALLVAAFAQGTGELLAEAMQDRMHQPYRMEACPLLGRLLALAGAGDVLGVALSGAGPGVLVIAEPGADSAHVVQRMRLSAGDPSLEVVETRIGRGASVEVIG